ncbi:hypothetical protein I204_08550 [Kwoniella mangroviensis CBS 8886]|nr:hypothetical protein I204_08550 [Kwoniella mangroviensis CBS 8886]
MSLPRRHRFARDNEWNVGVSYQAEDIWLLTPTHGTTTSRVTKYPLITPTSLDYGPVGFDTTFQGRHLRIKVYPRPVHAIKSINSRLQGKCPQTLQSVKRKIVALNEMLQHLSTFKDMDLGGFRVELSLVAPTLRDAVAFAMSTPFFMSSIWLAPPAGMEHYALDAKWISRTGLFANANWVYQQTLERGISIGRGTNKPIEFKPVLSLTTTHQQAGVLEHEGPPNHSMEWHGVASRW